MSEIGDLIRDAKEIVYNAPQSDTIIELDDFTKDELVSMVNESIEAFEKLYDILEKM